MQSKLAKEEAEAAVRDRLLILRAGCSFARKICALNFWKHVVRSSSAGPENADRSAGAARVRAAEPREEGGQRR